MTILYPTDIQENMMQLQTTGNLQTAILQLQQLPIVEQNHIISLIELLYQKSDLTNNSTSQMPNKRQFGQYVGKGGFKMADDFEMTEEEFINL